MKRKRTKFKDLAKGDKIFRIVNLVLMAVIVATSIGLGIYYGLTGDKYNRIAACATMGILALVPYVVELIFRTRLSNILFFGLEIYLVFAGVVGSLLRVYVTVFWYDMFVHTIMGYLVAMLGIFIISKLGDYTKMSPWLIAVFCLLFSLSVELIWELCEWFSDMFVGQSAQGDKIPGFGAPTVTDTMEDILCNFSGALLFFIHYIVSKATHKSLGIQAMERELAGVGKSKRLNKVETTEKSQLQNESETSVAERKNNNLISSENNLEKVAEVNKKNKKRKMAETGEVNSNGKAIQSDIVAKDKESDVLQEDNGQESLLSMPVEELLESVAVANADEEKLEKQKLNLKGKTKK